MKIITIWRIMAQNCIQSQLDRDYQHYSFFNSIAGFVFAAFNTCQMTETNAISPVSSTATTKIQQ